MLKNTGLFPAYRECSNSWQKIMQKVCMIILGKSDYYLKNRSDEKRRVRELMVSL